MQLFYKDNQERIVSLVDEKFRYAELCCKCSLLQDRYPFLQFASIGQSVLGKPIWCIRLGNGKRKVHVNAAVHANEWITAPLLLRFIEEYAAALDGKEAGARWKGEAEQWYQRNTLWAVPMANPDGADLVQDGPFHCNAYKAKLIEWNKGSFDFSRWKANIRGVDLNDQFPAFWEEERQRRGAQGPSSQDYSGFKPLSEPEAVALANLTLRESFDTVLSLHSQGKEIYWNYRDFEPDGAEGLARRLAAAGGYQAVKLGGSDAGYKDWFIQEFRRPGFTIEVGEGVNPLPVKEFEPMYAEVSAILAEAMRA
ncbi:M14 family metallopeptidase [Paenibacillus caui]|uniref:M14 family metallopeptidase n=1 Tax=Paenibacillus caui TaxID=2873927 RepID=UPI001CA8CE37|nr:M14 family metallocarboxypeptidase [Paenibacillus caui]